MHISNAMDIILRIYRLLLTASSLSLVLWVYSVKDGLTISKILKKFELPNEYWLKDGSYEMLLSYCLYFILLVFFAFVLTKAFKYLAMEELKSENIQDICSSGQDMCYTYFGLFFYALSVPNAETLIYTFVLLCIGISLTTQNLFNPLFLFLGYKFYSIKTGGRTKTLMTKERIADGDLINFPCLRIINDYSYVELRSDIPII